MPKASFKRLIECSKEQLINLVLDIEKYPIFVWEQKYMKKKNRVIQF
jgi:ribosome-associated toxin RatA of RatAB toxin-antitoxin module